MKTPLLLLAITVLACATRLSAQENAPSQNQPAATGYEQPYSFSASALFDANFLRGPNYQIGDTVWNDGLDNHYRITTEAGGYDVKGDDMLRTRVAEFLALEELNSISRGETFGKAMAKAGKAKLNQAGEIIADPIGAVKSLPSGIGKMFSSAGKAISSAGKSRSGSEGSGIENATGVARAKRALAVKIGVDPYSSNKELQKALGEIAWAQVMGGLTMSLGTSLVLPPGVGLGITVGSSGLEAKKDIVEQTPEELRAKNRRILLGLGIPAESVNGFFANKHYSPTRQTIITRCLLSLGSLPTLQRFVDLASSARDENGAYFYQRTAMLMATYNNRNIPIHGLQKLGPVVVCRDVAGNIVIPANRDYVLWTSRVAGAANAITKAQAEDPNVRGVVVLVSGEVSPRLRGEIAARQFKLTTRAFGKVQ